MKKEKSQPEDTTGAGPGKDSYNTTSSGKDNAHRVSKPRQDGQGEKRGPNAGDSLWSQTDSEQEGANFS